MFDSSIPASTLVTDLKDEIDIAPSIPNRAYIMWLNSLEQLLYREIIKEQKCITVKSPINNCIDLSEIPIGSDESRIRFEDIHAVYADNTQLIKSTLSSGAIFPNTFYKTGNNMEFNTDESVSLLKIIYFVKPALKTVNENDAIGEGNVMLPVEFIDLATAKIRGEAYKTVNEDSLAAKWINDYNILLENFKAWMADKAPEFGI